MISKRQHANQNTHSLLGVTMLELLIVIVIIGILSAVSIPTYQAYIQETRRSDAMIALTTAAADQERFYTYDNSYTTDINNLGGSNSPEGFYTLSVTATATTFTLMATAAATGSQQADENCRIFILSHLGAKTSMNAMGAPSTGCW